MLLVVERNRCIGWGARRVLREPDRDLAVQRRELLGTVRSPRAQKFRVHICMVCLLSEVSWSKRIMPNPVTRRGNNVMI